MTGGMTIGGVMTDPNAAAGAQPGQPGYAAPTNTGAQIAGQSTNASSSSSSTTPGLTNQLGNIDSLLNNLYANPNVLDQRQQQQILNQDQQQISANNAQAMNQGMGTLAAAGQTDASSIGALQQRLNQNQTAAMSTATTNLGIQAAEANRQAQLAILGSTGTLASDYKTTQSQSQDNSSSTQYKYATPTTGATAPGQTVGMANGALPDSSMLNLFATPAMFNAGNTGVAYQDPSQYTTDLSS